MFLEQKIYYQYPNKRFFACKCITPTDRKGLLRWVFQAPKTIECKEKRIIEADLSVLVQKVADLGFTMPEETGRIEKGIEIKGLTIKPSHHVVIRPMVAGRTSAESISFQFDPSNIPSFTSAIENAVKTKDIVVKMSKLASLSIERAIEI